MSCNADKTFALLARRQLAARQAEANAFLARRMQAWNARQGYGKSPSLGSHLLGSVADIAITEAKGAVGRLVRSALPQPTAQQREASHQRYLHQLFAGLLLRAVPMVKADAIVGQEACLLHLLDQITSGELAAAVTAGL